MPFLLVVHGIDRGHRFELRGPSAAIGRDPANPIQVHDSETSRRHAEIRLAEKGRYRIIDLGSANGTLLNGEPVDDAPLHPGDHVQVGQTVLLYSEGSQDSGDLTSRVELLGRPEKGASLEGEDRSSIVRVADRGQGSRLLSNPVGASDWLRARLSHLSVLYQSTRAVTHILDLQELLPRILELVFETVGADRGAILLADSGGSLRPEAVRWRDAPPPDERLEISRTIIEHVHETGQGVITTDAPGDSRFDTSESIVDFAIREAICVPIHGRHASLGVIYADARGDLSSLMKATDRSPARFTQDHLMLMAAIGHQAGLAIENTRLLADKLQAERLAAVGEAIATLSHHIKNVLQGLKSGSYLIDLGLQNGENDVVRKGWTIVEKNQNKIYHLVMDMLSYSKDREPARESADLNRLIGELIELMQARANELNVTLDWFPASELPELLLDPEGIQRAVLNILSNALDACVDARDARVEVATAWHPDEEAALVRITDNGIGIAVDSMEQVFQLFASTKGTGGTGLGLPVARKIIREHGGDIEVSSRIGDGTTFLIRLPRFTAQAKSSTEDQPHRTAT